MECPYPNCQSRRLEDRVVLREYCIDRHNDIKEELSKLNTNIHDLEKKHDGDIKVSDSKVSKLTYFIMAQLAMAAATFLIVLLRKT